MIAFYDENQDVYTDSPLRAVIDGHRGGSFERKFYLRNDDGTRWFSNVTLAVRTDLYDAVGELGTSGISIKFMFGERRPTEAEWDLVRSGSVIELPDIGSIVAADTFQYYPCWIRVYVPGGTPADIIDSFNIKLSAYPRLVGT